MQRVHIFSVGSCDTATRLGRSETLLVCGTRYKYIHQYLKDTTAYRCILSGLLAGVVALKAPSDVTLVTATNLGFNNGFGFTAGCTGDDIVFTMLQTLQTKDCRYAFYSCEGRGAELRALVCDGRDGKLHLPHAFEDAKQYLGPLYAPDVAATHKQVSLF